jgi:hypothetical protein
MSLCFFLYIVTTKRLFAGAVRNVLPLRSLPAEEWLQPDLNPLEFGIYSRPMGDLHRLV